MSLFDILRYSSIDLDSKEELDTLPEKLLKLYNDEVHGKATDLCEHAPYENYSTRQMARWRFIGGEPKKPVFLKALKKYSDDNI